MSTSAFDGVVFAGGGCRCFWQAGFYSELEKHVPLKPDAIAAASAGAALASVCLTGQTEQAVETFMRYAASNKKNLYPERVLFLVLPSALKPSTAQEPVFPHEGLFRRAVTETIDDAAMAKLQQGPSFHVALTRAPESRLGVAPRLVLGLVAYRLERQLVGRVHSQWPAHMGLQVEWARADLCQDKAELTDLLLQTSCTPPFTSALKRSGRPVLDGGLSDNVPLAALSKAKRALVLLTRHFDAIPPDERVTYVQPSRPIPIGAWDYTQPGAIQAAFDLGCQDAKSYLRDW